MGNQRTFASLAWNGKGKVTRRDHWLATNHRSHPSSSDCRHFYVKQLLHDNLCRASLGATDDCAAILI
jgi:hypothetical protein